MSRLSLHRSVLASFICILIVASAAPGAEGEQQPENPPPLSPQEALAKFTVPDDLRVELVLAEPEVAQPLFMDFDERGRLWVVQYRQYPYPAGLKMLSRDEFWRAVYDKVPPPPPDHFVGADKISIHEDTDGDGQLDKHKTFVEGLNIVTSFARGRGGVWVLNPPYLLFYVDKDNDDTPDGPPEVHLEGFGLADTHSVANSLRFGPDGWLYACQGSTVSGHIKKPGDKTAVHSMGQLIWRYHPEKRKYEIFAEGGGNAYGAEIDEKGRIYSGHNGGDTRGFHYVQGGYFQKGFGKHGPLSNPYAFGYFSWMKHHAVERFTHDFMIYEETALPEQYRGKLFGADPMHSFIVMAEITPDGSTFQTKDIGHPLKSSDARFRPVEIKTGPDGAIYVADFYERQISHREHFAGNVEKETGRIWRLTAKDASFPGMKDVSTLSSGELVLLLHHPNRWSRQMALRLLGDRKDPSVVPLLRERLMQTEDQTALEYLWALYQSGGFDEATALAALGHAEPFVRQWAVRLLGDEGQVSSAQAEKLAALALGEPHVQVRSQLASSALRLPAAQGLPIVRVLLARDEDSADPHLPLLLWWAIEAKAESDRGAVSALFEDSPLWQRPIVQQHILSRVMRRYAQAGKREDLLTCAKLFALSPDGDSTKQLMAGFEEAYKGRSLAGIPQELAEGLAKAGGGSPALGVRQGREEAIAEALKVIADPAADATRRLEFVQVFGEVKRPQAVPALLDLATAAGDAALQSAALAALQLYDDPAVGDRIINSYAKFSEEARGVANSLLASRQVWAKQLAAAVAAGTIAADQVPEAVVRKMTVHRDEELAALIRQSWGDVAGASTEQMQQQIEHFQPLLAAGGGDPYNGKKLYTASCAKCHALFGDGGRIGPDLTPFKRDDVRNLLVNVVNPSAEIREGFEVLQVVTADGRVAAGFRVDEDNQVLVLRDAEGQNVTLLRDDILESGPAKKSLMPEGLLDKLNEQEVRDLFAYLRSQQPLNN